MKKLKSKLIAVLSVLFLLSVVMFTVACNSISVKVLEPLNYHVGDNVHVFDLFEYVNGVDYEFSYTVSGGDEINVEGETLFIVEEGVYEVKCKASKGRAKTTALNHFVATEKAAYMVLGVESDTIEFEKVLTVRAVINRSAPKIVGNMEHAIYLDSVTVYKKGVVGGEKIQLIETVPIPGDESSAVYKATNDGFFDGKKFNFIYECDYVFNVVVVTTGGKTERNFKISAIETFNNLPVIEGLTFNKETLTASWNSIDGASIYRVKAGSDSAEITETTIDLNTILPDKNFHYFDLAVIPKDADGNKLGVMVEKDIIITPEGSEGVIEGVGATINPDEKTVVLQGKESYSLGWRGGLHETLDNSHIAFYGDYGVGTFVEFTFTGNNLPNVCFFADKINGDMTSAGGKGFILMNGVYTPNKGASNSTTKVAGENVLVLLGPDRFSSEYQNYIVVEQSRSYWVTKDTLYTQKALNADETGRTYRYVVGTINNGGMLAFSLTLYDAQTNQVVVPTIIHSTTIEADSVEPGHIIAYATVKGRDNNTVFGYDLPYDSGLGVDLGYCGATFNEDDSVTLSNKVPLSLGWFGGIGKMINSFITVDDDVKVGTYVDFTFKGNNMPQVMLFANKANGVMTNGASAVDTTDYKYTGYVLTNGMYAPISQTESALRYGNKLFCFGPDRISGDANFLIPAYNLPKYTVSTAEHFTQEFLKEDDSDKYYVYTVGSYENIFGEVIIEISIKDKVTGALLAFDEYKLGKNKSEVEALGSKMVAYACVNGEESTTFSYGAPYQKLRNTQVDSYGAYFNEDGSVILSGKVPSSAGWKTVAQTQDSYIAFDGEGKVGKYFDFTFTGNNLPQVTLFANEITDKLGNGNTADGATSGDYTGYILMNGLYWYAPNNIGTQYAYEGDLWMDYLVCFGPNKYHAEAQYYGDRTVCLDPYIMSSASLFTQNKLKVDDSGDIYKYTVGSYENKDGIVIIEAILYNVSKSAYVAIAEYKTGKTVEEIEKIGDNVIVYGCYKKEFKKGTAFSFSQPYTIVKRKDIVSSGAVFGQNNMVTLEGRKQTAGLGTLFPNSYENSYIGFSGNYGVGTYVDFTFKGNNLPQVTLFANEINGNMGCGNASVDDYNVNGSKHTGFLLVNGMYTKTSWSQATGDVYSTQFGDRMLMFGPNRISPITNYMMSVADLAITSTIDAFEQDYLSVDTSGTEYKYTVGSYVGSDDYVYIEISITNLTTNVTQTKSKSTGLSETECEALGGNIIAFGCCKEDYQSGTTFKFSEPYTK
ncbi:MAG: hypothetical protein IKA11_01990 [Clostridia bacterium]|nr:hypothetical protein [Clostridia bacterium]